MYASSYAAKSLFEAGSSAMPFARMSTVLVKRVILAEQALEGILETTSQRPACTAKPFGGAQNVSSSLPSNAKVTRRRAIMQCEVLLRVGGEVPRTQNTVWNKCILSERSRRLPCKDNV